MRLNLGCADRFQAGFRNVDIQFMHTPPEGIDYQTADLSFPWPWEDSSIEEVLAEDIIEHIASKIHFMNQLHRVLVPGGVATILTPDAGKGGGYWQDPTHKSGWVLNSFQYFQKGSFAHQRFAASYGISAAFDVVELGEKEYPDVVENVWKIRAVLRAVK